MIKKRYFLFSILISILLILPLVNAASFDFGYMEDLSEQVIDNVLGILSPVLEKIIGEYSSSDFFFHKILLLILLIIIIKNILDRTPIGSDNKRASLIIAMIVSILAIRFINENNFFEAIFIQYGVLGVAITAILPMVIFFYFIHNTNIGTFGRKVFWTIYGVILIGIWISKSSELPEVANWIYGIIILLVILFIFLDKTIHSYFGLSHLGLFMKEQNKESIWKAKERIVKWGERLEDGIITEKEWKKEVRKQEKIIRELLKE